MTYASLEKCFSQENVNRRCIDGRITGKGKCVGYCLYEEHPGYLTAKLRSRHECEARQCRHFLPKIRETEMSSGQNPFRGLMEAADRTVEEIYRQACRMSRKMEGLVFLKAGMTAYGSAELTYVSISDAYPVGKIAEEISKNTGWEVNLSRRDCSWDESVRIVREKM